MLFLSCYVIKVQSRTVRDVVIMGQQTDRHTLISVSVQFKRETEIIDYVPVCVRACARARACVIFTSIQHTAMKQKRAACQGAWDKSEP